MQDAYDTNKYKLKDIPPEFIIWQSGTPFIRFGGFLYLASKMGVFRCETKDVSKSPEEYIYECKGWIIPSKEYLESKGIPMDSPLIEMFRQPVVTHGTTNAQNLKANMAKYAVVMAETRSIVRCLRILTECPYTAEDEMEGFNFSPTDAIENAKNAGILMSALDTLEEPKTEPTNRREFIQAITALIQKYPAVKTLTDSFIAANNVNMLTNLKDAQLRELYNNAVQMVAE